MRLRLFWFLLPMVIAFSLCIFAVSVMVRPNMTHSMPYGLYLRLPVWGEIHEGDLVQLESPMRRGYLGSHAGDNLLKRVERVSGSGLIYVRGESDDSYDSRYYGFVAPEYIKARIVPLTVSERPLWPIGNIRNLSSEKE